MTHNQTAAVEGCELLLGNPPDTCRLCASPLSGRRRVWCTELCESTFYRNHLWTSAREYARSLAVVSDPDLGFGYRCARCQGLTLKPEVNHKQPVLGRHGQAGCHHHQAGLEVLCHGCHVDVTNAQRARGWHAAISHGELALWQQPDLFGDVPPVELDELTSADIEQMFLDIARL